MKSRNCVLIYQLGSLGDTVVSTPCYREIARRHPDCDRYVLTSLPVGGKVVSPERILLPTGLITGSIYYPMPLRSVADVVSLKREIARLRPSVLYYLVPETRTLNLLRHYLFFRLCGIAEIHGIPWSRDLRFPRQVVPGERWESEASRLLRTIGGATEAGPPPRADRCLDLTNEEIHRAAAVLDGLGTASFVAISVGGKIPVNDWGDQNWSYVLRELSRQRPGLAAVFVGSADERMRNDRLADAWRGPTLNACGLLAPRETAALLRRASLFIGHDTGTLHLAAAVETRVIGIYSGRNRPGKWYSDTEEDVFFYHPLPCSGCEAIELTDCPHARACLSALDPDAVVAAAADVLNRAERAA